MKAIEFKSKLSKTSISIPKNLQSQLRNAVEKNVRVKIWFEDSDDQDNGKHINEVQSVDIGQEELESINRGLNDFKEGRIHSHETARKLYEKYL